MNRLLVKLYTRKCRNRCSRPSPPHTHHLTWIGWLRYGGPGWLR